MAHSNMVFWSSPGDLLDHVAEVHIQLQDIRVPTAVTATLVPAVALPVFRRARSLLNPASLLSSVSKKRLKLQKRLPRPRTPATHQLQPRVPHLLISPAQNRITHPGRGALPLHPSRRRDPEPPLPASLSPLQTNHPRGPPSSRPAGTETERARMTLYTGTRGKHQHLDRAKTRRKSLVQLSPHFHHYRCHKQLLNPQTKGKGVDELPSWHCRYSAFNAFLCMAHSW